MMKRNPFFLLGMALVMVSATACLKTVTNNSSNSPAFVTVVNVVPAGPSFNVLVDNVQVGTQSTFPYMSYDFGTIPGSPIQYLTEYAGVHSVAFTDSVNQLLVSGTNIQFSANTKYSIWLFDTLIPGVGLNAVQLSDSYDSVPTGQILVRFLNFCPNSAGIEVQYNNVLDSVITPYLNSPYIGSSSAPSSATLSQYIPLPVGNYFFKLMNPGTDSVFATVNLNAPTAGKVFTIMASGLLDSTGAKAFTTAFIPMN